MRFRVRDFLIGAVKILVVGGENNFSGGRFFILWFRIFTVILSEFLFCRWGSGDRRDLSGDELKF